MGNYIDWEWSLQHLTDEPKAETIRDKLWDIADALCGFRDNFTTEVGGYYTNIKFTQVAGDSFPDIINILCPLIDESFALVIKYYDSNNGIEGFAIIHGNKVQNKVSWSLKFEEDTGFPIASVFGMYPSMFG